MFFDIITSVVKKKTLYWERYVEMSPVLVRKNLKSLNPRTIIKKRASKITNERNLGRRIPIGTTGLVQLSFTHNLI